MQDPRIERWLTNEAVSWEYVPAVAIAEIDIEASKRNQARVNAPIVDDLVERYTLALIDGNEFPAVIGYRNDAGRVVLLDGNQRCAAAIDAERSMLDVYVCSGLDDMQRTALCWSANGLNGDPGSQLDHILLAKTFHQRYPGIPRNEVARRFHIKPEKFDREIRADEVSARMHEFGLDPDTMSQTNKDRLHAYIDNDTQFREAGKFVQEAGLKGTLASEFWADFRRARSEKDALGVIETWRNRKDIADLLRRKRFNRPLIPKSRMQHLIERMNGIHRFLERYPDVVSLEVAGRDEVATLSSAYKALGPLIAALVRQSQSVRAA